MTRLVIDASVLLSGIASSPGSGSPPALILDALTDMGFEAVVSPRLIAEVNRGLQKPYFKDLGLAQPGGAEPSDDPSGSTP
ncbi:MAG: PIN domain-containing protein [Solirubrobacteraceae bacterium]